MRKMQQPPPDNRPTFFGANYNPTEEDDVIIETRNSLKTALTLPSRSRWIADWLFADPSHPFQRDLTLPPEAFDSGIAFSVFHDADSLRPNLEKILSAFQAAMQGAEDLAAHAKSLLHRDTSILLVPVACMDNVTVGYGFAKAADRGIGNFVGRFALDSKLMHMLFVTHEVAKRLSSMNCVEFDAHGKKTRYFLGIPKRQYSFYDLPNNVLFAMKSEEYRVVEENMPKAESYGETRVEQIMKVLQPQLNAAAKRFVPDEIPEAFRDAFASPGSDESRNQVGSNAQLIPDSVYDGLVPTRGHPPQQPLFTEDDLQSCADHMNSTPATPVFPASLFDVTGVPDNTIEEYQRALLPTSPLVRVADSMLRNGIDPSHVFKLFPQGAAVQKSCSERGTPNYFTAASADVQPKLQLITQMMNDSMPAQPEIYLAKPAQKELPRTDFVSESSSSSVQFESDPQCSTPSSPFDLSALTESLRAFHITCGGSYFGSSARRSFMNPHTGRLIATFVGPVRSRLEIANDALQSPLKDGARHTYYAAVLSVPTSGPVLSPRGVLENLEEDVRGMTEAEVQERKRQIRRSKNRASAARSNEARRQRLERQRRELETLKERMKVLRNKHKTVAWENSRLKERLHLEGLLLTG